MLYKLSHLVSLPQKLGFLLIPLYFDLGLKLSLTPHFFITFLIFIQFYQKIASNIQYIYSNETKLKYLFSIHEALI